MGLNSRDFVQLPENQNPDAGAEHMLPDRNDVLGERGSQQVSAREEFDSESSTASPRPSPGVRPVTALSMHQ